MAMRLLALTEKAFGVKVPVATLFQNPTIEQMAPFWAGKCEGRHQTQFNRGNKHPRLPASADARAWRRRRHVLGVCQPGQTFRTGTTHLRFQITRAGRKRKFETIEEMAESYLADLKAFQPKGPYHIGGYCFGGVVAYEMARRLEENNEVVEPW